MPVAQLEQGFRKLAHDWRNVLNGINLRVLSASTAETAEDCATDLAEVNGLIVDATRTLSAMTRKMVAPVIYPIAYPTDHLLEDLRLSVGKRFGGQSGRLVWSHESGGGKALVDYDSFCDAFCELLANSLRHAPEGSLVTVDASEPDGNFRLVLLEERSSPVLPENWGTTPFQTNESGHLGLGVYYARRVLTAHDGSLQFVFSETDRTLQTTLQIPLQKE